MRLAPATWWWCRAVQARLLLQDLQDPRLGNRGIMNTVPGSCLCQELSKLLTQTNSLPSQHHL